MPRALDLPDPDQPGHRGVSGVAGDAAHSARHRRRPPPGRGGMIAGAFSASRTVFHRRTQT
jgi:hypothetical protein